MAKSRIYWLCQLLGWGTYGIIQVFLYSLVQGFDPGQFRGVVYQIVYYLITTHILRRLIIDRSWLDLKLRLLIPRLLISTLLLSLLNYSCHITIEHFTSGVIGNDFLFLTILVNLLGYGAPYFLWIILYFAFHYVEQYNHSLREKAVTKEVELSNLKSQLNPHFIFNALNSIRALVDEDPKKSKNAITQLSHLMRNSLNSDRKKLISFDEELKTVLDYLALESIRYEERLVTKFEIDRLSGSFLIPPLMIQTLVENGIKHGISRLTGGGVIELSTEIKGKQLCVEIRNSGQLAENQISKGIGLENTIKRLNLIYGEGAQFEIFNESANTVLTRISLPKYI